MSKVIFYMLRSMVSWRKAQTWEATPNCRGAVDVFYRPSWLGKRHLLGVEVLPLCREDFGVYLDKWTQLSRHAEQWSSKLHGKSKEHQYRLAEEVICKTLNYWWMLSLNSIVKDWENLVREWISLIYKAESKVM